MVRSRWLMRGMGAVLFFLLVGGVWVGVTALIPDGLPQKIFIVALGLVFLVTYVWLLISRVRIILGGTRHAIRHGLIAVGEVASLLLAFAAIHRRIGIINTTLPDSPVVHDFWAGLYLSVVTFTTLGYGDFLPRGIGRALAGMQALTGYIVLGLLASVVASVASPNDPAGRKEEEAEEAAEQGREEGREEGRQEAAASK